MTRDLQTAVTLLTAVVLARPASADDTIVTVRASTTQGASIGATLVRGKPFCFVFDCSGSSGLALEGEAGLAGAKAAIGIGIADRTRSKAELLTLKASVLRSWAGSRLTPASSVFAGPELEVVAGWGGTIGLLKRVDGPGWRFSAGLVRAF